MYCIQNAMLLKKRRGGSNMVYTYAFVDYGDWEDYNFMFIKIHTEYKEKFRNFCKDTMKFGWNDEITIKAWVSTVKPEVNNDEDIDIWTIQEFQEDIRKNLEMLDRMGERHYLFGKREKFVKLLEYEFTKV